MHKLFSPSLTGINTRWRQGGYAVVALMMAMESSILAAAERSGDSVGSALAHTGKISISVWGHRAGRNHRLVARRDGDVLGSRESVQAAAVSLSVVTCMISRKKFTAQKIGRRITVRMGNFHFSVAAGGAALDRPSGGHRENELQMLL